jgi:NAD-dependent SIR2 family protein deacetylase
MQASSALKPARRFLRKADSLVIAAGAGIGVDSGLPDFRGNEGFWKAYPPFKSLGVSFSDAANPAWFASKPEIAWGFYGHRLALYRRTEPHAGFMRLLEKARAARLGAFVFTSNVDGQFQKAGFRTDRIVECHGSIHALQCTDPSCPGPDTGQPWSAKGVNVAVDNTTFLADAASMPRCGGCGALARPNILMFDDFAWDSEVTDAQESRLEDFLRSILHEGSVKARDGDVVRVAIVDIGSGHAVPTVRRFSERTAVQLASQEGIEAMLLRINPRDEGIPSSVGRAGVLSVEVAMGAEAGLSELLQA